MPQSPHTDSDAVVRLTVKSNGVAIAETMQVVSVAVTRAVNAIPSARLILLDGDVGTGDFAVSDDDVFKPGAKIAISAGYGEKEEEIFKGIVVKHALKITGDNYVDW